MYRIRTAALVGVALIPLATGAFVLQERSAREGGRLFGQVLDLVSERYVDSVSANDLYEKAARGLVTQLQDPYSITSAIAGLPTIILTTIGAKSRLPRVLPIACVPDGEKYALIASNFGQPHFPSWYHNVRTNAECMVRVGNRIKTFVAREIHGVEYDRYWKMAVDIYAGYAAYKERAPR